MGAVPGPAVTAACRGGGQGSSFTDVPYISALDATANQHHKESVTPPQMTGNNAEEKQDVPCESLQA